jgi:hypothetical protein
VVVQHGGFSGTLGFAAALIRFCLNSDRTLKPDRYKYFVDPGVYTDKSAI